MSEALLFVNHNGEIVNIGDWVSMIVKREARTVWTIAQLVGVKMLSTDLIGVFHCPDGTVLELLSGSVVRKWSFDDASVRL